jgi:phosphoglycerol transferase MdoB-like AlkP superfamily enzyme
MMHFRLTKHIKWILCNAAFLIVLFFLYRIILHRTFNSTHSVFTAPMFWLGLRFDLRTIAVILLPVYIVSGFFSLSPLDNAKAKRFWTIYLSIMYSIVVVFFAVDYQYYAYRNTRLDAEILSYVEDAGISLNMVWQSYPVVKILLLLATAIFLMVYMVCLLIRFAQDFIPVKYNPHKSILSVLFFFVLALCIYGKIGQYPLRWSDATSLNDDFKSNMVLNPMQTFFSSLQFRNEKPDIVKTKFYYPFLTKQLQFPVTDTNTNNLNFSRTIGGSSPTKPNVVVVLCESFSYYKTSMCNNPLDPTPYFNNLRKDGVFFTNCFSPAYGTARGVWATITGIPDVSFTKTATRIPRAVQQHTIINDFNGYDKYYFLGGSASWANIRGLLKNNISGLNLYEEEDYSALKADVWGISDRDLFMEANKKLQLQKNPFFAIIQTANNHRPYTIPNADAKEMGILHKPLDSLIPFGFNVENKEKDTNEEYNAMRYMDFCIAKFMEEAKKQTWFNNTIFVFLGDHGIRGNGGNLIPELYNKKGLTCQHIPLLVYSPLLKPIQHDFVCSQIDVLPTVAALAGVPHKNTTLGRDLFKIAKDSTAPKFAFIFDIDTKEYGIIDNANYYFKAIKGSKEGLLNWNATPNTTTNSSYYQNLANGFFQTARYLIYNNK